MVMPARKPAEPLELEEVSPREKDNPLNSIDIRQLEREMKARGMDSAEDKLMIALIDGADEDKNGHLTAVEAISVIKVGIQVPPCTPSFRHPPCGPCAPFVPPPSCALTALSCHHHTRFHRRNATPRSPASCWSCPT